MEKNLCVLIVNVNVQEENRIFFSRQHFLSFFFSSKLNRARHSKCRTRVYMCFFYILGFPMRQIASGYRNRKELGAIVNVKTTFMHIEHDRNRSK